MRRKLALLAAGLVAAGAMGIASADVIDAGGAAYVDTSDNSVWQESNGEAGLQRDADEDTAADTRLA
ncbi:MAG: hypothetical protein ABIS18_07655 [Actinomycetota bacterium]